MNRRKLTTTVVGAVALIGLASACGYGDDDSSDTAPATPAADAATVSTLSTPLGTVVVGEASRTLYAFDNDEASPAKSVCNGDCAATWPPVPATTDVEGVDADLIGSVTRDDGSEQLTINDNPVYLFANDAAAGDTNGHGVNGVWWAMSPDGQKLPFAAVGLGY